MEPTAYSAFAGDRLVAAGPLDELLRRLKAHEARGGSPALVFEDATGRQVDFDLRGTPDDVVARAIPRPGPGRPRLGVVSREVSLLPEHWEWLEAQPSGISAALRRLVDTARRRAPHEERARRACEAANRFMTALAGDRPGYEEATRALFAGDAARFARHVQRWPKDIREHVQKLAAGAFEAAAKR
jgi:hypothetical protein